MLARNLLLPLAEVAMSRGGSRFTGVTTALFLVATGGSRVSSASAEAPTPGSCASHVRCAEVRAKVAAYRREFRQRRERLVDKSNKEPRPPEAEIVRSIADLRNLAHCAQCSPRLRSEAALVVAGLEGLIATHYDRWGPKKGRDGRRSFLALREAVQVDPDNVAASISYGKALVSIEGKIFKARVASYMNIKLRDEMESTAANLGRLLACEPKPSGEAREVHATLTRLLKK